MEQGEIINRVANSPLVTIDLKDFIDQGERMLYDLKDNLFQGLILKEKDFREFVKNHDFSLYKDKNVALTCTADAIVPTWAYMLLATSMAPYARRVTFGNIDDLERTLLQAAIADMDFTAYKDKKVVIKGCSDLSNPEFAFVEITGKLLPYVSSIMYGEPCSTVPIFKKSKASKN